MMLSNDVLKPSQKNRKKTSILTAKYANHGVDEWSVPILNSQQFMGLSRGDELEKLIGDPPIYLDYSSVSGGTL